MTEHDPIAAALEVRRPERQRRQPTERYAKDVAGMPAFAATTTVAILLGPDAIAHAVPGDDENCAIAQGCKTQLQTPYVSVGRFRTDLAMPHPKGIRKRGFGNTRWAVIRFENAPSARRVIIAADTGRLNGQGVVVELKPPRSSVRPEGRRQRQQAPGYRESKGITDGRGQPGGNGQDALTLLGVRNLAGQRKR